MTLLTTARLASLSLIISWSLLKLMSIESVTPSNHLIPCRPLLPLPSIFPSIRVFSNELALCIRLPNSWTFSFSISPSNEYSWLISFRIDWFDQISLLTCFLLINDQRLLVNKRNKNQSHFNRNLSVNSVFQLSIYSSSRPICRCSLTTFLLRFFYSRFASGARENSGNFLKINPLRASEQPECICPEI